MRQVLSHKSIVKPSQWAEKYRVMVGDFPGPWRFDNHPWLREMHDSEHEMNVGQKAAQMGYSECMLNIALYTLDIQRRNVLYILPNLKPDATDFTTRAINPAIEESPYISNLFSGTNNVGHKIVGGANFYIRGSNGRAGLKSIPASLLIFDEFEEHDLENTNLAEERSSGQKVRSSWKISTPTIPNKGINTLFEKSTKEQFFFECPSCSRMITMKFPESLIITGEDPDDPRIKESHLICYECKAELKHEDKPRIFKHNSEWVASNPGRLSRGFHINQLYSTVLPPWRIAKLYLESIRDITAEQEFFNSKLGLTRIPNGSKLEEHMIEKLIKSYRMLMSCRAGGVVTMGCDVGRKLHVEVLQWDLEDINPVDPNAKARSRVIWAGELDEFEELDEYMANYAVNFAICDALPETRKANEFASRFYGRVKLCRYNNNQSSRSVTTNDDDHFVSVNRTSWLDQSLGRFRNGSILLPCDLPRDYQHHIMAPIRVPVKDRNGQMVFRYLTQDGVADHYAHAHNYAEIALVFAVGGRVCKSITS